MQRSDDGVTAPTPAVAPAEPCPACGHGGYAHLFEKGHRHFWRCRGCRLELQYPQPTAEQIKAYYDSGYQSGRLRSMLDERAMTRMRAEHRLAEVQSGLRPGRWLDVGCSSGVFLECARDAGMEVFGLDLAGPAVAEARSRGIGADESRIEDHAPDHPYDSVTAFDVIEHTADPGSFLEHASRLLVDGGTIALSIPNHGSLHRMLMGRRWYFYIPDGHLFGFRGDNLSKLLAKHGFEATRVASTAKPITPEYAVAQLGVLNPVIDSVLSPLVRALPRALGRRPIPLRLGELVVLARKTGHAS